MPRLGALDTTLSVKPPVGAACDSVMGSEAVPPNGTFKVTGISYTAIVTRMVSVLTPRCESVAVEVIRCTPARGDEVTAVAPVPRFPSRFERHTIDEVRLPSSGSEAVPGRGWWPSP